MHRYNTAGKHPGRNVIKFGQIDLIQIIVLLHIYYSTSLINLYFIITVLDQIFVQEGII